MFFKKNVSDVFLLCDVGSNSIGLALIDARMQKIKVLFSERTLANFSSVKTYIEKQALLTYTLQTSEKEFLHSIKPILDKLDISHLHDAYIVFSSPWYFSKTTMLCIEKDAEFMLDSHSLGQVIDDEEKKFENEIARSDNTRFSKRDIHMIDREIMRVLINGYETSNPYFKKVKKMEFCLYMSIVPHDFLSKVDELLRTHFHVNTVTAYSFPLVCYEAVLSMFPHEKNLILIDAGGETTDVTVVNNGAIEVSESFPYGRNEAVKSIAQGMRVPVDVATSYLQMMQEKTLEAQIEQILLKEIERVTLFWFERWLVIRNAMPQNSNSKRIFLTAKDDFAPMLSKVLKEKGGYEVFSATDELLHNFIEHKEYALDPSVALEAVMLSKKRKK